MTSMPDATFIILYMLYKIGSASLVMGIPLFSASVVMLIRYAVGGSGVFNIKVPLYTGLISLLFLSVGALTPNIEEVKTYAAYTIYKTTSDTEKAQELIDTVIHYIEDKPAEK